jgi:hypothetical protein
MWILENVGPTPSNRHHVGVDSVTHVLLTRFNTRLGGYDDPRGLDPAWLEHRFRLFEDLCIPSVRSQTEQRFTWLVFFDARTPTEWRRRAEIIAPPGFHPIWVDGHFTSETASEAIKDRGLAETDFLITSRLDNDDALAPRFMATVRAAFSGQDFLFVNLPFGYQVAGGRLYMRPYVANPFISLIERVTPSPETVLMVGHHEIMRFPVRQVMTRPAWFQVVHGRNLANELRGVRVSGRHAHGLVPAAYLSDDESRLQVLAEGSRNVVGFVRTSLADPTTRARAKALTRKIVRRDRSAS